ELLAEFELKVEISRSYADPEIFSFLSVMPAEKTLFLSDFYMSSEMLRRLIAAKGMQFLAPDGLSSCDLGLNKRSGNIFRHVHSFYAVSPEQHLHVGDNSWSDVSSPSSLGITALHYLPSSAHAKRLANEHLFSSREVLFDHIREESMALAHGGDDNFSLKQIGAASLGIKIAPLFIGFVLWVAEQSLLQKLDKLFFFTREGEFFFKIFCELFPNNSLFGHTLPPADILSVSRLSTFSASMEEVSIQQMSRVWSLFKVQSISGLFTTLGLDITKFSEVLDSVGLKKTDVIHDPASSPELIELFRHPEFTSAFSSSVQSNTCLVQRYLKQSGLNDTGRFGVVDIGWRGTIQDNIALLLPNAHLNGFYLGLRRFINPQPDNVTKSAFGPNENISSAFSSLFSNFAAMELLCNSENGSVVGYELSDECVSPLRIIDYDENAACSEFSAPFQRGVLIATHQWQQYIERYAVSSHELHELGLSLWELLRRTPGQDLVDMYLRTPQHDLFGYGEIFKRSKYPSVSTIFLSAFLPSRRRKLIDFIRRVQWSEAIESASDIGVFHRWLLLLVFRMANVIKQVRFRMKLVQRNKSN
ncbi:hydrolase, partial [Pseudomonas sp.]|uniref:hydrolase n=1 Tax=Pseudomonas sp. TaxID=306 RepID=UPI0025804668